MIEMRKIRSAFTMTELLVTMAVFSVFMLFFFSIFQVIIKAVQYNKQISSKMYAEAQLENAFSVIARELQWGGSMSGNLANARIEYTSGDSYPLSQFGTAEFGDKSVVKTADGLFKIKYAQVEKGILRKFSSYDEYYDNPWDNSLIPPPTIEASFSQDSQNKVGGVSIPATEIYFSYIGGRELYDATEEYWPKSSTATATVWVFSMDSLSESSPTTLTYWGTGADIGPKSHYFKTQQSPTHYATGLYHVRNEELGDYFLTLAYRIPEYPPRFKGIDIGGTQEYFGEIISKTSFWIEDNSKLKMSKYIPTVNATMTQTLFEPIKAATFTIFENYVQLDLIYQIPDPGNPGLSIEYRKSRKFWTIGAG
jgi:prepilin-type N-terminal cleavage/methylation domain-containing protein